MTDISKGQPFFIKRLWGMELPDRFELSTEDYKSTVLPLEL